MINKQAIIQDLRERKLTQGEIAIKNNCSRTTVIRLVKSDNLQIGRGVRNHWEFTQSSEELAYIIGAYLTDGNVARDYRNKSIRQFSLNNTSDEFIQKAHSCLIALGLNPRFSKPRQKISGHLGSKTMLSVSSYSSMFSTWLYDTCQKKSKIPDFLIIAPLSHQLSFLAGAIDGDGHVTKFGSILIRGVDSWLKMLPRLLELMNIRSAGLKISETLSSGKIYYRVSIHRTDLRGMGGWCVIPFKYDRLLNAADTRGTRKHK